VNRQDAEAAKPEYTLIDDLAWRLGALAVQILAIVAHRVKLSA
jgi:hypothetical protein